MVTPENRIALEMLLLAAMFVAAMLVAHPAERTARVSQPARKAA